MTPYIQKVVSSFDEKFVLPVKNDAELQGEGGELYKESWIADMETIKSFLTHSLEEYKRLVLEALPKYKMPDLKKQVDASTKAEIFSSFGHNELLREIRDKIQSL